MNSGRRPARRSAAGLGQEDVVLLAEALGQLATRERLGRGTTGCGRAAAARFCGAPVPAGMSLPMMTFSLRPSRLSLAPLMAASVSTRVVSWKEAAARNDEVLSDALVTPSRTVSAVAGSPPSAMTLVVELLELEPVDQLERQLLRVARLVDAHLAQHLPDDDLDVLVVDGHALAAVNALDFLDEIALDGIAAARLEVLLRVDGPVGDRIAGTDQLAVLDEQLGVVGDGVLALDHVLAANPQAVARP